MSEAIANPDIQTGAGNQKLSIGLSLLSVSAGYFICQVLSTALLISHKYVEPIWMPLGFMAGIFMSCPVRRWPVYILAAALAFTVSTILMLVPIAEVVVDTTVGIGAAAAVAAVMRRFHAVDQLFRPQGLFLLLFITAVLDAVLVVPVTFLLGLTRGADFPTTVLQNAADGLLSVFLVAPITVAIVLALKQPRISSKARLVEGVSRWLLLVIASYIALWINNGAGYTEPLILLPLPLLLWSAVRFDTRGPALDLLTLCVIAFAASKWGGGPFRKMDPNDRTYAIQLLIVALSIPILFTAAAMSERRAATEAVRTREKLFRAFIEHAPVPIALVPSPDKSPMYFNPEFTRVLGYSYADLNRPEDWWALVYPDPEYRKKRRDEWLGFIEKARQTGHYQDVSLSQMRARDGRVVTAQARVTIVEGFRMSFIDDITARVRAEQAAHGNLLRTQALATELTQSEERQRRELAAILHDDVGQNLFAAMSQLIAIRDHEKAAPEVRTQAAKVLELLDNVSRSTRDLTFQLCPPELYQMGLAAAMQRLAEQFTHRFDIAVSVSGTCSGPVDLNARGMVYNGVRELLTNVAKHAGAKHVAVTVAEKNGQIEILVCDDGAGFRQKNSEQEHHGFGLFQLRERLQLFGGNLEIESKTGEGTCMRLTLPSELTITR